MSARRVRWIAILGGMAAAFAQPAGVLAANAIYTVGPITNLGASCAGQNAEVEQAVDPARGYVYEEWMGCSGIAF